MPHTLTATVAVNSDPAAMDALLPGYVLSHGNNWLSH